MSLTDQSPISFLELKQSMVDIPNNEDDTYNRSTIPDGCERRPAGSVTDPTDSNPEKEYFWTRYNHWEVRPLSTNHAAQRSENKRDRIKSNDILIQNLKIQNFFNVKNSHFAIWGKEI